VGFWRQLRLGPDQRRGHRPRRGSTRIDDAPDEIDDLRTDFLLPLAMGLKWFNRMDNPSWAIRVDVRDNIIWFESLNGDTDPENNWEISAGFSILFGE
jgi:hypothetical protein